MLILGGRKIALSYVNMGYNVIISMCRSYALPIQAAGRKSRSSIAAAEICPLSLKRMLQHKMNGFDRPASEQRAWGGGLDWLLGVTLSDSYSIIKVTKRSVSAWGSQVVLAMAANYASNFVLASISRLWNMGLAFFGSILLAIWHCQISLRNHPLFQGNAATGACIGQ